MLQSDWFDLFRQFRRLTAFGSGLIKQEYSIVAYNRRQGTILKSVNKVGYPVASFSTSISKMTRGNTDMTCPETSKNIDFETEEKNMRYFKISSKCMITYALPSCFQWRNFIVNLEKIYWSTLLQKFLSHAKEKSSSNFLHSGFFLLIYVYSELFNVLSDGKKWGKFEVFFTLAFNVLKNCNPTESHIPKIWFLSRVYAWKWNVIFWLLKL